MGTTHAIEISGIDHIGVRVKDLNRALDFYRVLGFDLHWKSDKDAVAIIKNAHDVEINLIYNANADSDGKNILMDVAEKYSG
ncbi:MAG: VOC family protein, partial [Betaproteobacteria bacterium]